MQEKEEWTTGKKREKEKEANIIMNGRNREKTRLQKENVGDFVKEF